MDLLELDSLFLNPLSDALFLLISGVVVSGFAITPVLLQREPEHFSFLDFLLFSSEILSSCSFLCSCSFFFGGFTSGSG